MNILKNKLIWFLDHNFKNTVLIIFLAFFVCLIITSCVPIGINRGVFNIPIDSSISQQSNNQGDSLKEKKEKKELPQDEKNYQEAIRELNKN